MMGQRRPMGLDRGETGPVQFPFDPGPDRVDHMRSGRGNLGTDAVSRNQRDRAHESTLDSGRGRGRSATFVAGGTSRTVTVGASTTGVNDRPPVRGTCVSSTE